MINDPVITVKKVLSWPLFTWEANYATHNSSWNEQDVTKLFDGNTEFPLSGLLQKSIPVLTRIYFALYGKFVPSKKLRLLACDCALTVLNNEKQNQRDPLSLLWQTVHTSKLVAKGKAKKQQLHLIRDKLLDYKWEILPKLLENSCKIAQFFHSKDKKYKAELQKIHSGIVAKLAAVEVAINTADKVALEAALTTIDYALRYYEKIDSSDKKLMMKKMETYYLQKVIDIIYDGNNPFLYKWRQETEELLFD